jgi:carbamoyltransferase
VAPFIWYQLLENERRPQPSDQQQGSLLGPVYSDEDIRTFLETTRATYQYIGDDAMLCDRITDFILDGKVVGWLQGRMEFGPRALGNRSLIGDARRKDMQTVMNMKVEFRESFRPFAPVVLREHAPEYFEVKAGQESPYMLL